MDEMKSFLFITVLLALPGLLHGITITIKQCARALLVSLFGVMLPVVVFFESTLLVPEWKGGCTYGWLDCMQQGKLALSPFVLWGTISLYAIEFFPEQSRHLRWVALGLFMGALTAGCCLLMGIFWGREHQWPLVLGLFVPFYITAWLTFRAAQVVKMQSGTPTPYIVAILSSVPFCVGAAIWSRRVYERLPDNPPECFVVTAASRGHSAVVGPFAVIERHDRRVLANDQLIHFWKLEAAWTESFPRSHKLFRFIYNRWAPMIARRIVSPLAADCIYLLLKPAELLARVINALYRDKTLSP